MVITDTSLSYDPIEVQAEGDKWKRIFNLYLQKSDGSLFQPGEIIDLKGKLQCQNGNAFNIEYRIGLFVYPDGAAVPAVQDGTYGCVHPITGENAGPYGEVTDKYVVLHEAWSYVVPVLCSSIWVDLRASARSTKAVLSTRLSLGNGFLQAKF